MLHFGVLGPLEVGDGGRLLGLGRPKQRAVLATLLLQANAVVSVDRFVDTLWPGAPTAGSAGSLPVYIANLRRLVEPERPARTPPQRILTRAPGYMIRVAPGEYDVLDFERLLADGSAHLAEGRPRAARTALGEALALWRGPALAEFDFAETEAARLERRRLDALETRIVADLALGEHGAVVGELEGLVRDEPLRERLVELLMLALYRSGRQADALRAYATARDRLAEQVGCRPSPALRRFEADILAQSPALAWIPPPQEGVATPLVPRPPTPPAVPAEPFVGRTGELAVLQSALEGSSGSIVLVAGEPGIGKTRLVHEALAHARAAGRRPVLAWGRCEEQDGAPPFWPWIQVVRAVLADPDAAMVRAALGPDAAEIARVVPEVAGLTGDPAPPLPPNPASARYRFFDAVIGFLARLAGTRPVAVVLDDLHWADAPSLHLTGHLAGRLPAGVCLIATYRDVDPPPDAALTEVLAALARQPGRQELALRGWTRAEVAEFVVREAGADPPAALLAAVWDRAGGNPFFVGELTRLLVAEKAAAPARPGAPGVPWAVRQVVARRMGRLPVDTRHLLSVAAVAGSEFDLRVVARATGTDLDEALDQIDVAVAAGMVRERPGAAGCFAFSHTLVQEAVDAELTQLRRARLHGQVADALEEVAGEGAPAAEVAHHRYAAVPVSGPGPAVVAAGRAAAAAQAALAHEVAEEHLRRGLDLVATMPAGPERDHLQLDLLVQLAALLRLVKGIADPDAARAWGMVTELCRAVEDQRRLLLSLWGQLTCAWAGGDLKGARDMGEHMLRLDRASSDAAVAVTARLGLGLVAVCCGDLADGSAHLAAGKDLADRAPAGALADVTFADLQVQIDSWLSLARHLQGDHVGGDRLVEGALRRARALDAPFTLVTALSFATCARVLTGDLVDAPLLADEIIAVAEPLQLVDFIYHGRVVRAWALAHTGAPAAEVLPVLDALPSALTAEIRPWHPFWLVLIAEARQRVGDLDRARCLVHQAAAEIEAMGSSFIRPEVLRLRAELLAATGTGRRSEALAVLSEAARDAEEHGATTLRDRALASTARLERVGVDPVAR